MVPPICVEASSGIIFISRVYLLVEVRKGKYSLYNGWLLDPIHGVPMRPPLWGLGGGVMQARRRPMNGVCRALWKGRLSGGLSRGLRLSCLSPPRSISGEGVGEGWPPLRWIKSVVSGTDLIL